MTPTDTPAKREPRTKKEVFVSCLSCGQTSKQFVLDRGKEGLAPTAPCPKCSCTAYTSNLVGLWTFMGAVAQEVARMKLDIMDLQGRDEEER